MYISLNKDDFEFELYEAGLAPLATVRGFRLGSSMHLRQCARLWNKQSACYGYGNTESAENSS